MKKRSKGFTLMGVLVVIVSLGVIAAIVTTIVLGAINSAKKDTESPTNGTELEGKPTGGLSKNYTVVNDQGSRGIVDIGDEIEVNGENFYVISNDGTNIAALAKYNLNVGSNKATGTEGIQNALATGWVSGKTIPYLGAVAFSNTNGWERNGDDIDIQQYEGPVKTAINNYKTVVTNATEVRLITYKELNELGCSVDGCISAPKWLYTVSYWVGTPRSFDERSVWYVESDGSRGVSYFNNDAGFGVRPVIELAA